EPSATMIAQRGAGTAPAIRAAAEALPFGDDSFDVAMASLTLHHWSDVERGVAEMQRVAPRQVVFFFEPTIADVFWLARDFFPEFLALPTERRAPGSERLSQWFDVRSIEPVPVPADCIDGFGAAYWNRPERYLDADVQAGQSHFAQLEPALRAEKTRALRD